MPFNSLQYFLFLPLVYLFFYFAGDRVRWFVLLAASLLFYAALKVPYLLLVLALVTITTYSFGMWLGQASTPKAKLSWLWGGIAANVLILVVMKYLPCLSEGLKAWAILLSVNAKVPLIKAFVAIGVSYYVFQAISYLIDIYLEIVKPERHFGYFALHMAFFPKLLQGPIERAGDLLPQLKARYEFNYDNMRYGLLLFTWGLFKKVVIGDRLGLYVDAVYSDVHGFSGLPLLLATYAYAFQIYMDFSGYTDMALGSARLFNINLTQNFNSPYLARSVADFWHRWHISFSRWIFDYIFKPLQMQWRNWKNWGTTAALMVTFLVSGIWHGASWGFVIWGLIHGAYLASSVFYRPYQKALHKILKVEKTWVLKAWQVFMTFNLVSFAWIFFRATSLKESAHIISKIYFLPNMLSSMKGLRSGLLLSQGIPHLVIIVLALALYAFINHYARKNKSLIDTWDRSTCFRWLVYLSAVTTAFIFWTTGAKFIYFRF